jgi:Host cell surface-exposed lipoprotein
MKIIKWLALGFVGLVVLIAIASSGGSSTVTKTSKPAVETPKADTTSAVTTPGTDASPGLTEDESIDEPVEKPKPEMTASQERAVQSAEDYLDYQAFSKKGLIQQLSSDAGEGFPRADAVFAVNHVDVDWREQAVKAARSYLDMQSFSRSGLIEQLSSSAGEGFTRAQAQYAVNKVY